MTTLIHTRSCSRVDFKDCPRTLVHTCCHIFSPIKLALNPVNLHTESTMPYLNALPQFYNYSIFNLYVWFPACPPPATVLTPSKHCQHVCIPCTTTLPPSKQRWLRDEVLLEAEHARDPRNSRTAFYLAQTYDLNDKPLKGEHTVQENVFTRHL